MGMPPPSASRGARGCRPTPSAIQRPAGLPPLLEAFWDDISAACTRDGAPGWSRRGGVFGVVGSDDVLRGMGGGGPPLRGRAAGASAASWWGRAGSGPPMLGIGVAGPRSRSRMRSTTSGGASASAAAPCSAIWWEAARGG